MSVPKLDGKIADGSYKQMYFKEIPHRDELVQKLRTVDDILHEQRKREAFSNLLWLCDVLIVSIFPSRPRKPSHLV